MLNSSIARAAFLMLMQCFWLGSVQAANGATFISQRVPNSMESSKQYTVSVTYKNTGTTSWSGSGPHPYRLGARNPVDNTVWGLGRVELNPGELIQPGQLKTFTFKITAPYHQDGVELERNFQWGLVQEGVQWLHPGVNVQVGVAYAPAIATRYPPRAAPVPVARDAFSFARFKGANIMQVTYEDERLCNHSHGLPDADQIKLIADRAVAMGLNVLRLPVVLPPKVPGTPARSGLTGSTCVRPDALEWESTDSRAIMRRVVASTRAVLDQAQANNLKVVLVLDGYTKYDKVCYWKQSFLDVKDNAATFVGKLRSHPALLAWDVMNEPMWNASAFGCLDSTDDYQSVVDAVHAMYNLVRAADASHPTTVGEHKVPFLKYWQDISSYASPHLYVDTAEKVELASDVTDLDQINFVQQATLSELSKASGGLPMVIGEFGVNANDRTGSDYKAAYYERYLNGLARDDRGFMLWNLSLSPLAAQQDISVLSPDGGLKPAAEAVARQQWYPVVQQLFLAYTGRPADPEGLRNLAHVLLDLELDMRARALPLGRTLAALDDAYQSEPALREAIDSLAGSREFQALYGAGPAPAFVSKIFRVALGRTPDQASLASWSDRINYAGLGKARAPLAILAAAQDDNSPQGLTDATTIKRKVDVAAYFSASLDTAARTVCFNGAGPAGVGADLLRQVDAATNLQRFLPEVESQLLELCHQ